MFITYDIIPNDYMYYDIYIMMYYYNKQGHYVIKRTKIDTVLSYDDINIVKNKLEKWKSTDDYKLCIKNIIIKYDDVIDVPLVKIPASSNAKKITYFV